jgi:hypothetical protein
VASAAAVHAEAQLQDLDPETVPHSVVAPAVDADVCSAHCHLARDRRELQHRAHALQVQTHLLLPLDRRKARLHW